MKTIKEINHNTKNNNFFTLVGMLLLAVTLGCEREDKDLRPATFPNTAEIYIDQFSAGLEYAAFGDSKVTAFTVDENVSYEDVIGTSSMRFDIPNEGDPEGPYAGGVFRDLGGRDLTGYNALTFYAQATKAATVNLIGFGNDFMGDEFSTTTSLKLSTSWTKYIIPIPDPAKLTQEKGLLVIAEGPEDGDGYSIWLDVVKFEQLGTLAHPRPAILNGEDVTSQTFIGVTSSLTGLTYTVNLPNGADQTVTTAPAYFAFTSSDTTVAKVDELGIVSVVGEGTAKITAVLAGEDAAGSLTIISLGEFTHAPIPDRDAADVISLFSDTYTNVPVEYYNGYYEPFQTTKGGADIEINGDNIIRYYDLNFVATQFSQPTVNATEMTHVHVDIQVEDQHEGGDFIRIELVDFGLDGTFGGGDDSNGSVIINGPPLETGSWASLDIPLTDFDGLSSTANLAQFFFISDATISNILVDNMYLYKGTSGGGAEPIEAAPVPTHAANDVISIFSDAYTNLEGTDYPDWGQSTLVSEVVIAGDNTLKFAGLNFQGIQLASSQDISGMGFLHLDFWTENSTVLNTYLISSGPVEVAYELTVPTSGWSSVDIPLSSFSTVDLADIIQMKFDGNGDIYLDNIYFHTSGGAVNEPTVAAPTPPSRDAADVISLFSNAYTDETVDTWSADWDDSEVADVQIAGDDVKKYTFTNFAGIDFSSNKLDAAGMTNFHMDIWTPGEITDKSFTIKNVDFGGGSAEASNFILTVVQTANGDIPALAKGSWVTIDVPISAFTGDVTRSDLAQMVLSSNLTTVYIDNIYFYKTGGGGTCAEPTIAPPTPTEDAADVISVFSDAYTDIASTNFDPDWGQSTVVTTESIGGENTLKYDVFNYQGTNLGGADGVDQDLSSMEFLHIDMWTCDATVVEVTPISRTTGEKTVSLTPINTGQWNSYDIPVSDFAGVSMADIFQMKFDGQAGTNPSKVFIDNIYFYKTGGGGTCAEPTVAPPTPTEDAADVISVFSDAYTDIASTNFDPDWGQSTVVTTESIGGENTLKYDVFNYQGTNLGGADGVDQDLSSMEFLHIDMWTCDATVVEVTPISRTTGEKTVSLTPINTGQWNSYDIPVSDFAGVSMADIFQMKFDGQAGTNPSKVFIDNIYFYKTDGGGTSGPDAAAPTPAARDAADVVSIYSDAYTDITFDNFDAGWCGGAAATEVSVASNNTLKKNAGIDCHGIDFQGNRHDLSSFTHIHFDFYTDDTDLTGDVFNVKLVDFAGGSGEASALEVNINTGTTPGIEAGVWVSVDIDITSLGGVVSNNLTRSDVAQIAITTANLTNVWYDNIYLYK